MDNLGEVLARLEAAVSRLEDAVEGIDADDDMPLLQGLNAERDRLSGEVESLRARTEADAQLRSEAAQAVRQALSDLRGAVGDGGTGRA